MKTIVEKLALIEKEIAEERGEFVLFALMEREGSPDRWDLVASASWIDLNLKPALDYFVTKINKYLTTSEVIILSRVVLLQPSEPFVTTLLAYIADNDIKTEIRDFEFNGMVIERGYIISADTRSVEAPVSLSR